MNNEITVKGTTQFKYSILGTAISQLLIFIFPNLKDFSIEYLFVIVCTLLGALAGLINFVQKIILIKQTQKAEEEEAPEAVKA